MKVRNTCDRCSLTGDMDRYIAEEDNKIITLIICPYCDKVMRDWYVKSTEQEAEDDS